MKVGQLLATILDGLPDAYIEEMRALQSEAPAVASLGQVHHAYGLNDRALACKLQYPDLASKVEADLRQLKLILGIYKGHDLSIDTREILHELTTCLREELDYRRETTHLQLFGEILKNEVNVRVPVVLPELSTRRLLAMTWLEGGPLLDAKSQPQLARNRIAENMFAAWYRPFYRYGVLHGDPYLGNYTICARSAVKIGDSPASLQRWSMPF